MHVNLQQVNRWSNTLLSIFFYYSFFDWKQGKCNRFLVGLSNRKVCHQDDGFNSAGEAITARATLLARQEIVPRPGFINNLTRTVEHHLTGNFSCHRRGSCKIIGKQHKKVEKD